ncbi:MAG: YkvA family protein [Melioribacteraceae bacterium]|nr:YkvA family protein [Melioribacteraceae bacterium]
MNYELDDLDLKYDSPSKVEKGEQEVEERLWEKLERVGKKISFAKDIKALYRYMRDKYVPWYRKSIVIGALIYFISPIDAVPDLAPLVGYLDDLGVITAVLKFMGSELIPYYE